MHGPVEQLPVSHEAQRALERRWRHSVSDGRVPAPPSVRGVVRESWLRSMDAAVSPVLPRAPIVWTDDALVVARERTDWFGFAHAVLERADGSYTIGGHILTLFDAQGRMLEAQGDPHALERLADINFRPGGLWAEAAVGTNGPGTALAEGRAVHIIGAEHFCERWHPWHCAAVPVRDPLTTEICGVVDVSGFRSAAHPHTLAFAATLAAAIEQMMAAREAERRVLVLRALAQLTGRWPGDPVLAVDRRGAIIGASAGATADGGLRATVAELVPRLRHDAPVEVALAGERGGHLIAHPVSAGGAVVGACVVVRVAPRIGRRVTPRRTSDVRHATRYTLDDVIGSSTAVRDAVRVARQAAATDVPVLLLGESGTGKEVFAQGIHAASARSGGAFVAVNCAALPRELIESELFGYVGGAFSGARADGQAGKFEVADGGTIFLDEIAELPGAAQAALLRVLQEAEVTRVGATAPQAIDVRVIAATNRDVTRCVASGALRADLYHRLNVVAIELTPLRARGQDVRALAERFLAEAATEMGREVPALSWAELDGREWPGNVRELKNLMRRAVALGTETLRALGPRTPPVATAGEAERDALVAVVRASRSMTEAAARLGVTRSTLYRRLARAGLHSERTLGPHHD